MTRSDLRRRLKAVHAYAVTPFLKADLYKLDLQGLARNLEFLIEAGVEVINVGGGTGEIEALTPGELEAISRTALEVAQTSQTLITPTLSGNIAVALQLAPKYEQMGARVALAMPPFLRNSVPENLDGVLAHYRQVAEASGLLLLPYNTQHWPAEFVQQLAEIDAIVGVKDPCQEPHQLFRAIRLVGERLVWIGNKRHDPGVLHFRYQAGIEGFTAGFVNFVPRFELELHRAAQRQEWSVMVDLQAQLAPLERLRNRYGDGVLKAGLDLVGLCGGRVRPPRVDTDGEGRAALAAELERLSGL
jgi:4-hydroxy-tetrahydrodipicolinate synthase